MFQWVISLLGCPEQDSNLHASQHSHLKRARLPFRHLGFSEDKGKHLFSFLQIFSTFQYAFSLLFSFYFIFHLSLTAAILLSRSNLHEFLLLYSSAIIPAGCFSRNNARWLITNNQPISHTQQSWLTRFNLFSRLIFMFRSLFLSLPCSDFFTTPILYLWRFSRCAILFLHLNYSTECILFHVYKGKSISKIQNTAQNHPFYKRTIHIDSSIKKKAP